MGTEGEMGRGAGGGRRQRINGGEGDRVVGCVFAFQESFRGFSVSGKSGKDFCQGCASQLL